MCFADSGRCAGGVLVPGGGWLQRTHDDYAALHWSFGHCADCNAGGTRIV